MQHGEAGESTCNMAKRMKAAEFLKWLRSYGVRVDKEGGKGSHILLRRGDHKSFLPYHKGRDLKVGTMLAICKQLGISDRPGMRKRQKVEYGRIPSSIYKR